jgi:hypothetical protein
VRDFTGDQARVDRQEFGSAPQGRKVAVTFNDGETLLEQRSATAVRATASSCILPIRAPTICASSWHRGRRSKCDFCRNSAGRKILGIARP